MVIDDSKTIRRTAGDLAAQGRLRSRHRHRWFRAVGEDLRPAAADHFVDHDAAWLDGIPDLRALIKNNQMFKSTPVVMLSSKDGLF